MGALPLAILSANGMEGGWRWGFGEGDGGGKDGVGVFFKGFLGCGSDVLFLM